MGQSEFILPLSKLSMVKQIAGDEKWHNLSYDATLHKLIAILIHAHNLLHHRRFDKRQKIEIHWPKFILKRHLLNILLSLLGSPIICTWVHPESLNNSSADRCRDC